MWFSPLPDPSPRHPNMEVITSLFAQPMRALSRVIYGCNDYLHPPSPIMRLSDDELTLIFAEVIDSNDSLPLPDPFAALILSHVCSLWRAIVLSKSSLWARMSRLPPPAVDHYLFRSGSRPLSIRLLLTPLHDMSVGIALSVIKRTHRCKELHWIDESPHCVLNVSAFSRMARFPVLEVLELASRTVVCLPMPAPLGGPSARQSQDAVLYPALRDLTLAQIHPAVFCAGLKAQLRRLALKNVPTVADFRVSHLLSILADCPHLECLELVRATPIIDVHPIEGRHSGPSGPIYAPFVWRPTIPIKKLVFDCAPTIDLWRIFVLLNMPSLESLSHVVPATIFEAERWPHSFANNYPFEVPDDPITPQVRTLSLEYEILNPKKPLAQLVDVTFPNLEELRITYTHHLWDHEMDPDRKFFERVAFPPPEQPLFVQGKFARLRCLVLAHVSIDIPRMCAVLRDNTRALEHLTLNNCVDAGQLICALGSPSPYDICLHGHRHPLLPTAEEQRHRRSPEWLGLKLRSLVLVDCADVRIDCLRKLITTCAAAAQGVHDVEPHKEWKSWCREEHEAVRGWMPCRIETLTMEGCRMVTEGGVNLLRSLTDAPDFRFGDDRKY